MEKIGKKKKNQRSQWKLVKLEEEGGKKPGKNEKGGKNKRKK